jgi:hypothetical protein
MGKEIEDDFVNPIYYIAYIPTERILVPDLRPIADGAEKMVFIKVPDKPILKVEVSTWEKMQLLWSKLGGFIDVIIKILPIIIPIFTILRWATNINKKEK